jgi:hypothetical protein
VNIPSSSSRISSVELMVVWLFGVSCSRLRMVDLSEWMDWSGLKGTQAWNGLSGGWVRILTRLLRLMIFSGPWVRLDWDGRTI